MDDSILNTILGGAGTVMIAAAGYFNHKIGKVEDKTDNNGKDIAAHKLHISENYAKNTNLAELRVEQIESTKRIHEVISDIQADIKTLIKGSK